uniref:Uncharacterized protein n=1 Tax=Spongospora subterranea TaxID=70186 RepID=A0A0H5QR02_9EUKA|eukprot:CRZ04067.1 hypothetical protein [Spongospora subterranea]
MNADETFALFYREDKMLVPSGTKRVGNLVPVENEKKDVTASSVSSIFSSALYHRYRNVWRRSYASMAALTWIHKMFTLKRILLVVDRSTTHFGRLVTDWLETNHASESIGKVYL